MNQTTEAKKITDNTIRSITFASTQGGYSYFLGQGLPGQELAKIAIETRHIQGDPYDFYVGRTANGQVVFEANRMNASIVIEYQTQKP